jgi:5,5'-dehydrodivanillate O-demethylase
MARPRALEFEDLEPVGPGTPAGRYLRLFWQPVMRARDLPRGKARPLEVLGEKFTIYRGEDGAARVVAYRCPHRGTPLSLGWVEGDSLRCRYHGWRFDCTGQCLEQPNEDRPFADKIKMESHPTQEYVGLIFAYLGEGEPPPFRRYPDLDRPGIVVADPPEVLPCTYWNKFDNDHGHRAWVHRATALRKGRNDVLVVRHEEVEETPYGWRGRRSVKGEAGDMTSSLGTVAGERESAQKDLGPARATHWFMPNMRLFFQRSRAPGFERSGLWETKAAWTVPISDTRHAAFDVTVAAVEGARARAYEAARAEQEAEAEDRWDLAEKILAGEMTLEGLPDDMTAYTSFTIEDYVTQVGQGPLKGRSKEHLGPSEQRTFLLRRLWLREVNALVGGRPLTDWTVPETPLAEAAP